MGKIGEKLGEKLGGKLGERAQVVSEGPFGRRSADACLVFFLYLSSS